MLSEAHYDYAHNLVQILGFKSLKDWTNAVVISDIPLNVTRQVTDTMPQFKELFPLSTFDLARINYQFSTVEQVIGFAKKVFIYLNISAQSLRIKGKTCLRLNPPNILYHKYIEKMTEIVPKSNVTECDTQVNDTLIYSKVLEKHAKLAYMKTYSFRTTMELGCLPFGHIDSIEIHRPKVDQKCNLSIGGQIIIIKELKENETVTIPVGLPGNKFHQFHEIRLHVTGSEMTRVTVHGRDFKTTLPSRAYRGMFIDTANQNNLENKEIYTKDGVFIIEDSNAPGATLVKQRNQNHLNMIKILADFAKAGKLSVDVVDDYLVLVIDDKPVPVPESQNNDLLYLIILENHTLADFSLRLVGEDAHDTKKISGVSFISSDSHALVYTEHLDNGSYKHTFSISRRWDGFKRHTSPQILGNVKEIEYKLGTNTCVIAGNTYYHMSSVNELLINITSDCLYEESCITSEMQVLYLSQIPRSLVAESGVSFIAITGSYGVAMVSEP